MKTYLLPVVGLATVFQCVDLLRALEVDLLRVLEVDLLKLVDLTMHVGPLLREGLPSLTVPEWLSVQLNALTLKPNSTIDTNLLENVQFLCGSVLSKFYGNRYKCSLPFLLLAASSSRGNSGPPNGISSNLSSSSKSTSSSSLIGCVTRFLVNN